MSNHHRHGALLARREREIPWLYALALSIHDRNDAARAKSSRWHEIQRCTLNATMRAVTSTYKRGIRSSNSDKTGTSLQEHNQDHILKYSESLLAYYNAKLTVE